MKIFENNRVEFVSNFLFYMCIIGLLFVGVYSRVKFYLLDLPFWLDEITLSLSFFDRDFWGMFTQLEGNQKTPPLFCAFVWIIKTLCGEASTLPLRFISLFTGVSSIVAFFFLLKDFLKSRIAIIVGMSLFVLNVPLLYYSQEFKPYSSDVLSCILLILLYKRFSIKNDSVLKTIVLSTVLGCFFLFSFPCMFIIPAMFLLKVLEERCFNKNLFIVPIGFFLSTLYLYFLYRQIYSFEIYEAEWQVGFLTFSFDSFWAMVQDFVWFLMFGCSEYNICILFLLFVWGLFLLCYSKKKEAYLILLIILFAVIASFLKIYPLKARMILYFIPFLFLAFSKVIDYMMKERRIESFVSAIIMSFFIFYNMHFNPISFYFLDMEKYNMRTPIEERYAVKETCTKMLDKMSEEDILFSLSLYHNYAQYYSYLNKGKIIFSYVQLEDEVNDSNIGSIILKFNEILQQEQGNSKKIYVVFAKENCKINGETSLQVLETFEKQINFGKYSFEKSENDKYVMYKFCCE